VQPCSALFNLCFWWPIHSRESSNRSLCKDPFLLQSEELTLQYALRSAARRFLSGCRYYSASPFRQLPHHTFLNIFQNSSLFSSSPFSRTNRLTTFSPESAYTPDQQAFPRRRASLPKWRHHFESSKCGWNHESISGHLNPRPPYERLEREPCVSARRVLRADGFQDAFYR
jgi:hypothetical protein